MPHPLQQVCEVRVQTNGEVDPLAVVINALDSLDVELQTLTNRFKVQFATGSSESHELDAHDIMRL